MMAEAIHITFLIYFAACDLDRRRLPGNWLLFHLSAGLLLSLHRPGAAAGGLLCDLLPGLFVMMIGLLTKEAIGYGDGWVLFAGGLAIGGAGAAAELMAGLILSALWSLGLLGSGRGTGKTRLPFVPFLACAELLRLLLRRTAG